jgi:hypothetical protein
MFAYAQSTLVAPLTIQTYSTLNMASTVLPAGLAAFSSQIWLYVTAQDVYDAQSVVPASVIVTVTVSTSATVDLTAFLTQNLNASLQVGQASQAIQVINIVASTLNVVNCSLTSAAYCASLQREPCQAIPNTCGSCLQHYVGVVGPANSRCVNASSQATLKSVGDTCGNASECLYDECVGGVCTAPTKVCPGGSVPCSGHGSCVYKDWSGKTRSQSCTILETACVATCACDDGYGGSNCALSTTDVAAASAVRGQLCAGISSAEMYLDSSTSTLTTLASSLQSSYAADEVVTAGAFDTCLSALTAVANLASEGYLGTISTESLVIAASMTSTISNFIDSALNASDSTSDVIDAAVGNLAAGVLAGMSDGQYPVELVSSNVRLRLTRDYVLDLVTAELSPPLTEEEQTYGQAVPQVAMANAFDVTVCDAGNGYASICTGSYGRNPYPNSTRLETSLLRFSSGRERDTSPIASNLQPNASTTTNAYRYYVTLPFFSTATVPANMTVDEILASGRNYSFPVCRAYDGDAYVVCDGCEPVTYTATDITYGCTDAGQLCGGSGGGSSTSGRRSRRSLTIDDEPTTVGTVRVHVEAQDDDYSSTTSTAFTLQQYGAIFTALAYTVASVLSSNPFAVSLDEAVPMLALVAGMLVTLVAGGFVLSYVDRAEWTAAERDQMWPPQVDVWAVLFGDGWGFSEKEKKTTKKKQERQQQSPPSPAATKGKALPSLWTTMSFASFQSTASGRREDPTGGAGAGAGAGTGAGAGGGAVLVDERDTPERETAALLADVVPAMFRQTSVRAWLAVIWENHPYVSMFGRASFASPRFIRWVSLFKTVLLTLFIDTLFFQVFYANDGRCDVLETEVACLSEMNAVTAQPKCAWTTVEHLDEATVGGGSCGLRPPPGDFTFTILLALLTMVVAIPIDVLTSLPLDWFGSKRPDWEALLPADDPRRQQDAQAKAEAQRHEQAVQRYGVFLGEAVAMQAATSPSGTNGQRPPSRWARWTRPPTPAPPSRRQDSGAFSYTDDTFAGAATEAVLSPTIRPTPPSLQTSLPLEAETEKLHREIEWHFADALKVHRSFSPDEVAAWEEAKQARSAAIEQYLGISPQGTVVVSATKWLSWPTWIGGFQSTDVAASIRASLTTARDGAAHLERAHRLFTQRQRPALSRTMSHPQQQRAPLRRRQAAASRLWEQMLVTQLTLEHLSPFKRWVMVSKLGCFDDYGAVFVSPMAWLAAWSFTVALLLFLVYWILAWSVSDGRALFSDWGWNFLTGLLQDVCLVAVVKVVLFYAMARSLIVPHLRAMHVHLQRLWVEECRRAYPLRKSMTTMGRWSVVQYVSPTVRAAATMASHVTTPSLIKGEEPPTLALMLAHMDDADWQHCRRDGTSTTVTWHMVVIGLVPVMLELCGDRAAEIALDAMFLGGSSSFLLANHVLLREGVVLLAVPYVLVVGWLAWHLGVFRAAKAWQARRRAAAMAWSTLAPTEHRFHAQSAVQLSPDTWATLAPMAALRSLCLSTAYWATPMAYAERRREEVERLARRWAGANRPRVMGPCDAAASSPLSLSVMATPLPTGDEATSREGRAAMRQIVETFMDRAWQRAWQASADASEAADAGDVTRSIGGGRVGGTSVAVLPWQRDLGWRSAEEMQRFVRTMTAHGASLADDRVVLGPRAHQFQRRYRLATDVKDAWQMVEDELLRLVTPARASASASVSDTTQLDETQVMVVLASLFPLRCRPRGRCLSVAECGELRRQCSRWFETQRVLRLRQRVVDDVDADVDADANNDDRHLSGDAAVAADESRVYEAVVDAAQFRAWFAYVFEWYSQRKKHQRKRVQAGEFDGRHLPLFVGVSVDLLPRKRSSAPKTPAAVSPQAPPSIPAATAASSSVSSGGGGVVVNGHRDVASEPPTGTWFAWL